MQIQPNDDQIRKYIPHLAYFNHFDSQRKESLIGQSLTDISENTIQQRINSLEVLEQRGFVYLGEKNWLLSYLEKGEHPEYSQWVSHHLKNYLNLEFYISDEYDYLEETIWCADFNTDGYRLGYPELKNPAFLDMDELEILVAGDGNGPSSLLLAQAFEIMHSLEYAIATVTYQPKGGRELSVTGFLVKNNGKPSHWGLNVISDYGSDWEFRMIEGQASSLN